MAIGLIVGYALWQLRDVISGPKLIITSPEAGLVADKPLVMVEGMAKHIDWLYLNDRQIFTDEAGHFNEKLIGLPGYNMAKLEGKDKFGRRTVKMLEFVINSPQQNI